MFTFAKTQLWGLSVDVHNVLYLQLLELAMPQLRLKRQPKAIVVHAAIVSVQPLAQNLEFSSVDGSIMVRLSHSRIVSQPPQDPIGDGVGKPSRLLALHGQEKGESSFISAERRSSPPRQFHITEEGEE